MMTTLTGRHRWPRVFAAGLVAALLLPQGVAAQTFKKNGTAGFTFLQVPATARTAALGEASLALSEGDASAVFDNPAGLGFSRQQHSLSASYAPWFADIKQYAASYAMTTEFGVVAVGFVLFDYGSMPRTVVASGQKVYEVIGTFQAKSLAAGVSYATLLTDRFSFGATVKYARESIDAYSASNVLLDGGVLYYTGLGSFRIAATIRNFGVNARFINDEFKMPSIFALGAAVEVIGDHGADHRMTLLAEALHPNDAAEKVNVGFEYSWSATLSLRAGYKFFADEETFSVGLGVHPRLPVPFGFDVAVSDYGRLGTITRFTVHLGLEEIGRELQ